MSDAPAPPAPPDPFRQMARSRHRWERWLIAGLVLTLGLIFWQVAPVFKALYSEVPGSNVTLLAGLLALLTLASMGALFVLFRYLFRMILEGRWRVPGHRLRYRLVFLFLGFSAIPTILLFLIARGFIFGTIDRWFDLRIETHLRDAYEVAQTHYDAGSRNALHFAGQVATQLVDSGLLEDLPQEELTKLLESKLLEYNLGQIEIYSAQGTSLAGALNPSIPAGTIPPPEAGLLEPGLRGETLTQINPMAEGVIVRAVLPISAARIDPTVNAVVIVSDWLPKNLYDKMQGIFETYGEIQKLVREKQPIKALYFTALLVLTLLLLFAATWMGFNLSRSITVPITQLAEATARVAGGDLSVSIDETAASSEDEVRELMRAFNRMTADLRASKSALEHSVRELGRSGEESERRRRFMETVLANINAGVIAVDKFGSLQTLNPAAERLLGLSAGDALGRAYMDAVPKFLSNVVLEMAADLSARRAAVEEAGSAEGRLLPSHIKRDQRFPVGGEYQTFTLHLSLLHGAEGEYLGMVIVGENVTEMARSQRVAAWKEVARRIAHEIKNPLTPIQLSAQRIERRLQGKLDSGDEELLNTCVSTIVKQVEEMKWMVGEFSNFARLPESRPRRGDLNTVVAEAVTLYREAHRGVDWRVGSDPAIPAFDFDPEQIKRVMVNLLDNAVAATEGKGAIEVTTAWFPDWRICRIEVADSGPGIPPELRERIFEPYFSTKKEGTGLGLPIVAGIVSDHHGYIRCIANGTQGTRFVIELPMEAGTAGRAAS